MLEFHLQALASGRISRFCRLKPELQQPPTGFQDTLLDPALADRAKSGWGRVGAVRPACPVTATWRLLSLKSKESRISAGAEATVRFYPVLTKFSIVRFRWIRLMPRSLPLVRALFRHTREPWPPATDVADLHP
jgi:hypothetical protein